MTTNILSKPDIKKILKLREALSKLKSGEEKYYSITKLISLKSLCKDETIRQRYCVYLFGLVNERLQAKRGKDTEEQILIDLVGEIAIILACCPVEDISKDELEQCKNRLYNYQNQFRKIEWGAVRLIENNNLLIIEKLLSCLISKDEYALEMIYYATRYYVEEYNPFIGTGLITDSIPMFERVIAFWDEFVPSI